MNKYIVKSLFGILDGDVTKHSIILETLVNAEISLLTNNVLKGYRETLPEFLERFFKKESHKVNKDVSIADLRLMLKDVVACLYGDQYGDSINVNLTTYNYIGHNKLRDDNLTINVVEKTNTPTDFKPRYLSKEPLSILLSNLGPKQVALLFLTLSYAFNY